MSYDTMNVYSVSYDMSSIEFIEPVGYPKGTHKEIQYNPALQIHLGNYKIDYYSETRNLCSNQGRAFM